MDEEENICYNCQRSISAANFASHSAFCERNVKICALCNEPIIIHDEEKHLEESHIVISCNLCQVPIEKWMFSKHQEVCTKRPVTCEYCDGEFSFDKYPDHLDFCSSRTEKCIICKKYVMLKDKQEHSKMHLKKSYVPHESDIEFAQNLINEEKMSNSIASEQKNQQEIRTTANGSTRRIFVNEHEIHSNSHSSTIPMGESSYVSYKSKKLRGVQNSSASLDQAVIRKDNQHLENEVPMEASACAPNSTKEVSKHYTTCYICKELIPWIDLNTHIPSCASNSGKCSRCGEVVPPRDMKEHFSNKCKGILSSQRISDTDRKDADNHVQKHDVLENQESVSCPFCNQLCSTDRISEHAKNCNENYFQCPLCTEKVLERDRMMHETFKCRILLEINFENPTSLFTGNASEFSHESNTNFSERNKAKNSKSTSRSYASAARDSHEKNDSSKCKSCCPCNNRRSNKKVKHLPSCPRNNKRCLYCEEEISVTEEELHLTKCKHFIFYQSYGSESAHQSSYASKGAVPKHAMKPRMDKCKFCKTTLNADIIIYHEKECIHQPQKCERCSASVLLKDFENHICESNMKGNERKKDKAEGGRSSGIGNVFRSFFSSSEGNDGYGSRERVFSQQRYDFNASSFSEFNGDDAQIPCEFCDQLFPANEIVLHETGCNPEIACYKSSEDKVPKQSNTTPNISEKFFPMKENSSSKLEKTKELPSNAKPGEFLKSYSDSFKLSSSEVSEDRNEDGSIDKSSKSFVIQSVWNIDSKDLRESPSSQTPVKKMSDNEESVEVLDEVQNPAADNQSVNCDVEMEEMLEFINEEKVCGLKNDASYEEKTEPMYCESKSENSKEDLKGQFDADDSENFSFRRWGHGNEAFKIEPAENKWQEDTSVRKNYVATNYATGNNQDLLEQHQVLELTSQESHSENS